MSTTLLIVHANPAEREKIYHAALLAGISPDEIRQAGSSDEVEAAVTDGLSPSLAVVHLRLYGPSSPSIQTGLDVIRRLRTAFPQCVVIGLTAGDPGLGKEAIWAGAADFVPIQDYIGWKHADPLTPVAEEPVEVWVSHLRRRLELWRGVNEPFMAAGR